MSRFVEHLKALAGTLSTLGGPGLALLTFIDSSFLPLPEIPDLLLIGLVIQHPDRWPYYAAMATVGSLGGCYVLYALAVPARSSHRARPGRVPPVRPSDARRALDSAATHAVQAVRARRGRL